MAAPASTRNGFVTMHKPESTQQYLLQLSNGPSSGDEDRFASRVLTTILGDDSGSRMYWDLLDTGMAEAAGMGNYEYDAAGLIMTFVCCAPNRRRKICNEFANCNNRLSAGPLRKWSWSLPNAKSPLTLCFPVNEPKVGCSRWGRSG